MVQASILVVQDDANLAQSLSDMLSSLNYRVLPPAATGAEAVESAFKHRPKLVLMDIQLAGEMDSMTAARVITRETGIPIIFLTDEIKPALPAQAKRAAPYGCLVKPVVERDLAAAIEAALNKFKFDQKLAESEARFRNLADTAPVLIWVSTTDGRCEYFNLSWLEFTGRTMEQEVGYGWTEGVHPEDYQRVLDSYLSAFKARQQFKIEYRLRRASGEYAWVLDNGVPRFTAKGNFAGYIGACIDITERKYVGDELRNTKDALESANQKLEQALAREQKLARIDALTGVNNLRYLYELARHEFQVARRYRQPLSVMMLDVDNFKKVNDAFGHATGDQILFQAAQTILSVLRSTDLVGRYGGDEFVIILPVTNAQQAFPLAERIRLKASQLKDETGKYPVKVAISIGIAGLTGDTRGDDLDTLVRRADAALYTAKRAGRNQTITYQPGME